MAKDIRTKIIEYLIKHPNKPAKEIANGVKGAVRTIQRAISKLVNDNLIVVIGTGRGTKYAITQAYNIIREINLKNYYKKGAENRNAQSGYNFDLIETLATVSLFTLNELNQLNELQRSYEEKLKQLQNSPILLKKSIQKHSIELIWKSSKIEGSTYTLLETENLINENKTADNKTIDEMTMLLNHKKAIDFIYQYPDYLTPLTLTNIENIHSLLINDLGVGKNIRTMAVGVTGTEYHPIDNEHQIREALIETCKLVNNTECIFSKVLLTVILISYIQGFEDGNKRTARIVANGVLVGHNYCPLSYTTVEVSEFKKAILLFYEQNNISAFKKIFIEQYEYAVMRNY